MPIIRRITERDLDALKEVIDSNALFPSELLNDMTRDFLYASHSQDTWLTLESGNKPVAVAYFAPERMTEGTYNLYLIAIHREQQGKGLGSELMFYIEDFLRENANRILIVETSGLPEFEQTRRFYRKLNYKQEAVIREFYKEGEDKIVFWKKLG